MKDFDEICLDKLREIQPATNREWAEAVGYDTHNAFWHIFQRLRRKNKIQKINNGRPAKYIVNLSKEIK